jgi:hypothetical protein
MTKKREVTLRARLGPPAMVRHCHRQADAVLRQRLKDWKRLRNRRTGRLEVALASGDRFRIQDSQDFRLKLNAVKRCAG